MPRVAADQYSGEDLVRAYLDEIGRRPLLNAAQEVALAKMIEDGTRAGRNLEQDNSSLSAQTRADLEDRFERGVAARQTFAEANLRLVVSIARRYQGFGLNLLDLIQDGNIGMLRAVEKFDWRRGFKFSTYATWWIKQGITRGLANRARTIRLPVHVADTVRTIHRVEAHLAATLGREPTAGEIAAELSVDADQLLSYRLTGADTISLHTPIGEDGTMELQDLLVDDTSDQPLDEAIRVRSADELREALRILNPRERRILELRFGLADGRQRTLEQVGVEFKLTRERIRQIEARALGKLRHPLHGKTLREFMD